MPSGPLRWLWIGILASLLAYTGLAGGTSVAEETPAPTPERQAELANFVRQDCGSCHGLRFEGGLGVPLTPTALEGKSAEALRDTILYGRNGTTMPPWNPFLTEAEAAWIVQMLQKGLF
jgi:cytochrome c55X